MFPKNWKKWKIETPTIRTDLCDGKWHYVEVFHIKQSVPFGNTCLFEILEIRKLTNERTD